MEYLGLMGHSAVEAFVIMSDPMRLAFLFGGVIIGLALGVIPGIGGLVGMALLLPFTFDMDKYAAFALLLGMSAVTATSDVIPAVLFGVPGTVAAMATILDGYPMAQKGEAGRAFGACYSSSLIGGIFGAILLGLSIPILRPVMLYLGSPELLSFCVLGLSMVSVLAGGSPMRGIAAACFGVSLAMIGSDPQTGTLRWTFDSLYLWDGMPIVPFAIGLFAVPELADLAITRTSISSDSTANVTKGQWQGIQDTFRSWWLVLRCAWIGAAIGATPGLGASVVDWFAYGHTVRTEKGNETFGSGDVRGVIGPEAANNAKQGGALVPTIAFGVPGSADMAILLGAFLIHGLVPGPDMLSKNLDVTYSMVWSCALANILGAGVCFMFSNQFAKLAMVRYSIMVPMVMAIMFVGAFQGSRQWGDLYTMMIFGVIGWIMKRMRWPRPPIVLGFVLGGIIERYMFISVERYGTEWIFPTTWHSTRPVVLVVFAIAIIGLLRPLFKEYQAAGGVVSMARQLKPAAPRLDLQSLMYLAFIAVFSWGMWKAHGWNHDARIIPEIVGYFALFILVVSFLNYTFKSVELGAGDTGSQAKGRSSMHLDVEVRGADMPKKLIATRAVGYLAWLLGFLGLAALIGMIPALFVFVAAYMKIEGNESWKLSLACATGITIFNIIVFDKLLALPWPQTVFPDLYQVFDEHWLQPAINWGSALLFGAPQ